MVFLPSELWLHILSHTTSPRSLWRSVRPLNHQLRDCVEQHFKDQLLPTITLTLTFGLPCYDARNPLKGKAIFKFHRIEASSDAMGGADRVVCALVDVEPEHYMEQLLVRWDRLRESSYGYLPESLEWSMSMDGAEGTVRLREPKAFSNRDKTVEGGAVSFEWKATMTSFFYSMTESK